ncbi:MAG: hypothetical protein AB1938_23535 [Myxococcota bacterium]
MLGLLVASLVAQLPTAPLAPQTQLTADGRISFQHGVLTPPLGGTPSEAALRYAQSQRAALGLDARSTLAVRRALSTRFGGTVHLQQQVDGLDVHGARVVVTLDTLRRVVRVSSSLRPFAQALTAPRLSGDEALVVASRAVDGALLKPDGTPFGGYRPMAYLVGGDLHAGYLTYVPTLKNSESFHVAVDAVTGAVLWVQNKVHTAANDAKVYASSPGGLAGGVGRTPLSDVTLPHLGANADSFLTGEKIRALNCCPTEVCDPTAGPRRATGMLQTFGGTVPYDVAICDRLQRATNNPQLHPSGDYVYAPVDPPTTATPSINSPADYDEFAEVHAYFHVSKAYDTLIALSQGPVPGLTPFAMRVTGADKPAVWVNVSDPDFQNASQNPQGVYVSDSLARTDNAMFVARENMAALSLPEFELDSDAMVIYQGNTADFAYDGPVLWHEFGHGAIYSTADWDTLVSFDSRSANNESSALHEGVADVIAAMTGNDPVVGAYVGPRLDMATNAIRDIGQNFKCPDVLWGESHEDSLVFSSAVWDARRQFLGTDDGKTFDAAFYAAMISFPPDVNFEKAAAILLAQVELAFASTPDARAKLQAVFDAHGLTNCSKVLDLTDDPRPRTYFNLAGTSFAGVASGSAVPGPYQFKFRVPAGAKSLTMSGPYQTFGNNPTARLQLLARSGDPITFVKNGSTILNDAEVMVVPTVASQVMTATVNIDVPCGGELYFAVANTSGRDRTLYDLAFTYEVADSCPPVEPQEPDAGVEMPAPPPTPVQIKGVSDLLGPPVSGCGCTTASPLALLPALLLVVRRRRSRR